MIPNSEKAVPEQVLKSFKCNCSSEEPCSSNMCNCSKHHLSCIFCSCYSERCFDMWKAETDDYDKLDNDDYNDILEIEEND